MYEFLLPYIGIDDARYEGILFYDKFDNGIEWCSDTWSIEGEMWKSVW